MSDMRNKKIDSIIMEKYSRIGVGNSYIRDDSNFMLVDIYKDGSYNINERYPIVGNEEFLNDLEKELYDYNDNYGKRNFEFIKDFKNEKRHIDGDNDAYSWEFNGEWEKEILKLVNYVETTRDNTAIVDESSKNDGRSIEDTSSFI